MTDRNEIIRMAREAGCLFPLRSGFGDCRVPQFFTLEDLELFAALVAAHEREECAGICDRFGEREMHPYECAAAIRARGENK